MLPTTTTVVRRAAAPALLAAAVLVPAAQAEAKVSLKVTGWTTTANGAAPQVKNGATIEECRDLGNGQRSLYALVEGRGVAKGTKVGAAIWGGPPQFGMTTEPVTADVAKAASKWPVGPKKRFTFPTGFSAAAGPFGPLSTNGTWSAKVVLKGKVVATGKVTVAC